MYSQPKQDLTGQPGFKNYYQSGGSVVPIYKYHGYVHKRIGDATFNYHRKKFADEFRQTERRKKDNSNIYQDRPLG